MLILILPALFIFALCLTDKLATKKFVKLLEKILGV